MASMLLRSRNLGRMTQGWACGNRHCLLCGYPPGDFTRLQRRQVKRRERQSWQGRGRRNL